MRVWIGGEMGRGAAARALAPAAVQLESVRAAALDTTVVSQGNRRTSSVHEFYRYPARFPPRFARAVIEAFTAPADLVVDPFVGGGTSVVEARLAGRAAVGSDLSPLARFVTTAKTLDLDEPDVEALDEWAQTLLSRLNLRQKIPAQSDWVEQNYLRGLDGPKTWRIRNVIALTLVELQRLSSHNQRVLARCALLRTGQWALDMRSHLPDVPTFRRKLIANVQAMARVAREYAVAVRAADRAFDKARGSKTEPLAVVQQGLPGLSSHPAITTRPAPQLVLTSPPYPGVYVLYHRWKLLGRKEIPAPFWIAGSQDGLGHAHYTMTARSQQTLDNYFDLIRQAFADVARFITSETWIVQIVGFHDPARQLHRYLEAMNEAGFRELRFEPVATESDGRLWRPVPGRRWWVTASSRTSVAAHTAREVVLFHRAVG